MAVEVENGEYRFKHHNIVEDRRGPLSKLKALIDDEPRRTANFKTEETLGYFYHNPIHDVESVWWGCVELLFKKRVVCEALPELEEQYRQAYKRMQTAAEQIFPDMGTSSKRSLFLTDRLFHEETMSILPSALEPIAILISEIRNALVVRYTRLEGINDPAERKMAYNSEVVADFATLLSDAVKAAKGMKLMDFSDDWIKNASSSPGPVEERNDRNPRAGSKRKSKDIPTELRRSKRFQKLSTSGL
jgi:hypothetical protein